MNPGPFDDKHVVKKPDPKPEKEEDLKDPRVIAQRARSTTSAERPDSALSKAEMLVVGADTER